MSLQMKTDQNENIAKARARVVEESFSQQEGIDYFDIFAPTLSTALFHLVAILVLENDHSLSPFGIEQTFVQLGLNSTQMVIKKILPHVSWVW